MGAFFLFDPCNSLIYSHYNQKFEHFLFEQFKLIKTETKNVVDVIHNLVQLHLTPYVSAHRESNVCSTQPQFDGLPNTILAHLNWQEFVFIHLYHYEPEQDLIEQRLWLHRRLSLFKQLIRFLFGNALYTIEKYDHILKTMLQMIDKWDHCSNEISFTVESIEKLFLGDHLEYVCRQAINLVERLMKIHMMKIVRETPTCFVILYKNRLLYKHESLNVHLRQVDMVSVLLLSQTINLFPPLNGDLSSAEGSNFDESIGIALDRSASFHQQLVFLKSSINDEIVVPHIYRKVMVTDELYFVSLSEVSSILMISLPTLQHSVTQLKLDLNEHKPNMKKSIEGVINCVRNLQRYIGRNMTKRSIQPFRMVLLDQLIEMSKKFNQPFPNELVREQTDRILTLLQEDINNCYEQIAFKNLIFDLLPRHIQCFETIALELTDLLQETLHLCLDYIQVKYETNSLALATSCRINYNLLAFIFIDRADCTFVVGDLEGDQHLSNDLFVNMIDRAYRERIDDPWFVTWQEGKFNYVYTCIAEIESQQFDSTLHIGDPCELAKIIKSENGGLAPLEATNNCCSELVPLKNNLFDDNMIQIYELFAVFNINSSITGEQAITRSNIMEMAKLVKLYING